ncbi:MAG TPA: hypothetical protein V6C91_14590 [Coleofasciculaceae cyanobacterium]
MTNDDELRSQLRDLATRFLRSCKSAKPYKRGKCEYGFALLHTCLSFFTPPLLQHNGSSETLTKSYSEFSQGLFWVVF